jgi:S-adenosylmethionine:tRNA ribosyltransferase-isomerase
MDPRTISIHDFTYDLPDDRIAKYPLPERDASRLLVFKNGHLQEDIYRNIDAYIPPDSLLVFNDTKVVAARILFQKPTGASIEIFCLEPHAQYGDIVSAMSQKAGVEWMCLIGGASKWKHGQILEKRVMHEDQEIVLQAQYVDKVQDSFTVHLSWTPASLTFAELLHYIGHIPLPPYIKRMAEGMDAERYQTIYAGMEGSVAAPTAGLHFTKPIFDKLDVKNIRRAFVTLHVGAGTFKPVKTDTMAAHIMHAEFIDVPATVIEQLLQYLDKHITVTGTTSLRTLESLYWMGVKTILFPGSDDLSVQQWDAYEITEQTIPARTALEALLKKVQQMPMQRLISKTQLLIVPGYTMRIVHALVTNFHQPQSTLLLLVAAFIGPDWKRVYNYALENDFRFLSYGDGCLLFRE